jgi:hypothetical protein
MWALQLYIGFFLPNFHSLFREPTASIFRTVFSPGISIPPPTSWLSLGHFSSWAPGAPFFSHHGQVRTRIFHIFANTSSYLLITLQILVTWGIWLLCVQERAHQSSTSSLQVYLQHWHVVHPIELHLHLQSHPLILTFRILIPGSAVPTPPFFAYAVLQPGSILTHMSCLNHTIPFALLTLMLFFHYPLGMGVPVVFHHVAN